MQTIVGHFATRRAADLALEHLVQQHGVERTDVFLQAPGTRNSAGSRPAGADAESGHPGYEKDGTPELGGDIELSVDCDDDKAEALAAVLREAGATNIHRH